ncbi:MAG: polysaccharide biosynthesis protein [Lachnospiraceae bacterium]|nr:polysaccharide biosynthesis protein [Lachnospiraceae bacterium]
MAEDIKQQHGPEHMTNDDMQQHVPEHMANDNMPTSGNSKRKEKKERFIIQAIILAVAGFVSRILGLLYAVPLYHIIGEEGNGYYGTAYEIYNILLLITAFSMPTAISKIMSVYVSEQDYVNCNRLLRVSLLYVILVGGAATAITYLFADSFVVEPAVLSLKVMAPTIFFSGILSVLRGYAQAHNTMVPTALSQIIEQIFNAASSILLAYYMVKLAAGDIGRSILDFFHMENDIPPVAFGAMGSALGTLIGVLVALVFMVMYIITTRRNYVNPKCIHDSTHNEEEPTAQLDNHKRKPTAKLDNHKRKQTSQLNPHKRKQPVPSEPSSSYDATPEPYFRLFRVIFKYASPIILTSFLFNLSTTLDMKIFWDFAVKNGYSQETAARIFGIFSRQYMVLINVPIAVASAISSSMVPGLSVDFSKNEIEAVKTRISKAVRSAVVFAVPAVVGYAILAKPIMQLLFKGTSDAASDALVLGSISVLFFSVATVLNSGLQAMGKSFLAIKNVLRALIFHVLYVVAMLKVSGAILGILATGSILYSATMCFGNIKSLEKYFGCKFRVLSVIAKPVLASVLMGVIAIATYSVLSGLGFGNFVSLAVTIAVAVAVYFIMFYLRDDYISKGVFTR